MMAKAWDVISGERYKAAALWALHDRRRSRNRNADDVEEN
jgi:hypothetical protein